METIYEKRRKTFERYSLAVNGEIRRKITLLRLSEEFSANILYSPDPFRTFSRAIEPNFCPSA